MRNAYETQVNDQSAPPQGKLSRPERGRKDRPEREISPGSLRLGPTGDSFPGGKLSPLQAVLWPISSYLVTNITVTIGALLFRFLNRTIFVGARNVPHSPNTLLLSNHQTLIDSFLVGIGVFYPTSILRPLVMTWNPAAEENYYRNWFLSFLAINWKCIPVKKGRKDMGSIRRMVNGLKTSPLVLFPEGTRSRDGSIGEPRPGAGFVIQISRPTVIPVCIDGMDKVLPVGSRFPRFGKKIMVRYGKPLELSDLLDGPRTKESSQEIMDRVMGAIRALRAENRKSGFFGPCPEQ